MIFFEEEIDRWFCIYEECNAKCCVEGREITLEDFERISSLGFEDFAYFDKSDNTLKLKGESGKCIFLDENLKCKIENSKPLICKLLPFTISDVKYGDEAIMKLKLIIDCPGIGRGLEFNRVKEEIEKYATQFLHEKQKFLKKILEDRDELLEIFR